MKRKLKDLFNDAAELGQGQTAVVAEIANAAPVDDEQEWFQVAPYGEHPNRVGLQKFNQAAAAKIVGAFNSVSAKIGRLFRGAPIYAGHPDVDPARWPDSRRLGKIVELEARNDGLWAKAVWNSLGVENNENGYYVYPSPRWFCEKAAGALLPVELVSVGLTNTPNIRTSAPVTANDAAADEITPEEKPDDNAEAINAAVAPIAAARDAALAQVATLTAERDAAVARETELQSQLTAANDALANERVARRDEILDHAVESGRLTAAERPAMVALFNSDWSAAASDLAKRKPTYNTAPLDLANNRTGMETEHSRHVARQEAVNEIMAARNVPYDTAWELAKRSAKTKHLWPAT